MRADAAENAEHGLHQEGWLDHLAFGEMCEVAQVTDVVALELEARAVRRQCGHRELDILERVAKDQVAAIFQMLPLPCVLEVLVPVQQGKQAEIHRPMFSDASSGLKRTDGWMRSSIFMKGCRRL